jgi:hypothetical protein
MLWTLPSMSAAMTTAGAKAVAMSAVVTAMRWNMSRLLWASS